MATSQSLDEMARLPPPHCVKVFLHRDFSEGTGVRFTTKFPHELEGKVERQQFEFTVNKINNMFSEAESLSGRTYCESCFACLTAYLSYLCVDTYYEKMLKKIGQFCADENNDVYIPRGLLIVDPVERGLRVLEICILNESNSPQ